jgi:hypothetical protein
MPTSHRTLDAIEHDLHAARARVFATTGDEAEAAAARVRELASELAAHPLTALRRAEAEARRAAQFMRRWE